jgi:NTE family protein
MSGQILTNDMRASSPVELIDTGSDFDSGIPSSGLALCLSGGGYRAMLFHLGALWRLNEVGYLPKLDRISSVSGGSIIAGVLALNWPRLDFDQAGVATGFKAQVVEKIRLLAGRTIDVEAILEGVFLPGSVADKVIRDYRKYLYGDATLQDLPDRPRFVFNATNMQSGALWRFEKPYMRDYRVGEVKDPKVLLAVAVASSTAFPPFFAPVKLELKESDYTPGSGKDLQTAPYMTKVYLADGGVYDNLGLETAWKRYDTILVSDGGGYLGANPDPKLDWARQTLLVLDLINNQVRALRKRQVINALELRTQLLAQGVLPEDPALNITSRKGTYWGIRSHIADYHLEDALNCPADQTTELANTPTRMANTEPHLQERLINWGYAVCDAGLRKHVEPGLPSPGGFPYPDSGV